MAHLLGQTSKAITKDNLVRAELQDGFLVVDRDEVEPWHRVILLKVQKNTWQVLDEVGDDTFDTVNCTADMVMGQLLSGTCTIAVLWLLILVIP